MRNGDVVFAKSIPVCFENKLVRGVSTYRAPKGSAIAFLVLGTAECGKLDDFDAVAALKAFGWTPPPDLTPANPQEDETDAR